MFEAAKVRNLEKPVNENFYNIELAAFKIQFLLIMNDSN